jgi:hypothetical protein
VGIGAVPLTPELATSLLLGPFGGLDALGLRRLRLSLRAEELAGGGIRPSGELLVEGLAAPGRFATIDSAPGRVAARLAETLAQLAAADATIEELLWLAWERSRLAEPWRQTALGTGIPAAEANRDLDAIVALFAAAKDYVERHSQEGHDARRIATSFIEEILRPDVPEDVLAPRRVDDAVLVTTPSGVVGLEFRTVVVAGLQDGAWPNLRPRGSLLGPQHLVRAATGDDGRSIDERKLVLDDELRMFALAVSRARERVVLAAVANDDEARSVFFSLLPEETPLLDATSAIPLTLRGLTGRLRRTLTDPRAPRVEVEAAASSLAELARRGLPGADPADWHGLEPISSTGPLHEGEPVRVSPSRIERLEESPLDWFLETIAGGDSGVVANVGTIIHWAMETTPPSEAGSPSFEALWQAVEARWAELVFESPWFAERQQRLARGFTRALADYLADFGREGKSLVAAEGRFLLQYSSEELGDLPPLPDEDGTEQPARPRIEVHGSIDRVELGPDGSVVIVDLKTGRPITSQSAIDALPQLGAYQLAYAEGHFGEHLGDVLQHRAGGAKLLYVREGTGGKRYREGVQSVLDDAGLEEVRERIRRAAVLIAAAAYDGRLELERYGGLPTIPRLRLHRVPAVSSDADGS